MQERDITALNEALNDVLIVEENVEELRESTDNFRNFEHIKLARKLEAHPVLELRRIGLELYKRVGKYEQAIDLCKKERYVTPLHTVLRTSVKRLSLLSLNSEWKLWCDACEQIV